VALFEKHLTPIFNVIALTQHSPADKSRVPVGFFTQHFGVFDFGDPKSPIYNYKVPAYDISKTALNGYAVHRRTIEGHAHVNVAHPGSVVTDMNASGNLQVDEGRKRRWRWRRCPMAATRKFIHLAKAAW
jgi:NAD(P)-dependent dehydrogenase (short-subunit alcohol dehydrogenase family)